MDNIAQAVALLLNATLTPETLCGMCGGGHGGGHDMPGMMSMAFHVGHAETVLFADWRFDTVGGLVGSAVGVFFLGVVYEAFKYGRTIVEARMRLHDASHAVQTLMHAVQYTLSYFLMFIFMTYNVWLCVAVVAGGTVGYFLFGWKKSAEKDLADCCP